MSSLSFVVFRSLFAAALLAAGCAASAQSAAPALDIKTLRAGLAGEWQGKLEYRDYQADRWFGLPLRLTQELVADGVTLIGKAEYDDGPKSGTVRITSVSMFVPATNIQYSSSFRAGRPAELSSAVVRLVGAVDDTHWTMVEETIATDADRPAKLRETIVRDGARLTTLKEVDFLDDAGETWLTRNRTVLEKK